MQSKGNILIVEDDQDIRETLAGFLGEEGFTVLSAENGLEGLERLREMAKPCLVLLDIFMPVMNGVEFLEGLRSDPRVHSEVATRIIVISAAPPDGEIVETIRPLIADFIKKPPSLASVLQVVERHCGH